MTTSIRFCLFYDLLEMGFYRLKNEHFFSIRKRTNDVDVVNDATRLRLSVITHVVVGFFMVRRYPLILTRR